MNTHELNHAMRNFKGFKGTWPCDMIPPIKANQGVIVNTAPRAHPGEHWVAIYRPAHGRVEYFDSFGLPPLVPAAIDYMSRIAPHGWTYSMTALQHETTDSCGQHCVNFLKHRLSAQSMAHILAHMSYDRLENDHIVKNSI